MSRFGLKTYSTYLASFLFLITIVGVGLLSYRLGYRDGSGNLIVPPKSAGVYNAATTGDVSLTLSDPGASTDFGDFWKTWSLLDKNFVPSSTTTPDSVTSEKRVAGAIEGLVRSYNDPYTVFIPKESAVVFKEQVAGEFEGIGAGLDVIQGVLTVTGTLPDSPAQQSGIVAGDRIVAVDGKPTTEQDLSDIISTIRGPKGTSVTLSMLHGNSGKQTELVLTRGTVAIPTTATRIITATKEVVAASVQKASDSIATAVSSTKAILGLEERKEEAQNRQFFVLQLSTFAKSSTDAFIKDLRTFAKADTPYLIIDLRNNPGGYIETAIDLASYFLPKDAIVVTQKMGPTHITTEYKSLGYGALDEIDTSSRRIVVLINKNSASASEILAGALQDHNIAKIVGETSYGKGSVQSLVDIGTLGSLKITIARWYTPLGKNISHEGITPDIRVDTKDPKYASSTDPYIDAATETLLDDSLWD